MYCTSAIPKGFICIGINRNNVQHFKPLKQQQQQSKNLETTNLLPPPQQSQRHVTVNKILIKTEVLQTKVGRTSPKFWLTVHTKGI